jgi:hypothetical protein
MSLVLRRLAAQRARGRCEYCRIHQDDDELFAFHVDHIVARQHSGSNALSNLCFSCRECNFAKGTNLAGFWHGQIVPLYNPRRQSWLRHFRWRRPRLIGRTLVGKVTIKVLGINEPDRVDLRAFLIAAERFPPIEDGS